MPAGPASSANSLCAQALATTPRIAQERLVHGQGAWQSAAPAGRCTHERTAGEGAAACCGVVGVRAAHRHAADVAWRTREVPWQRRCFSASRCASLWSRRRDCDRWDAPAVPRQLQAGWDFSGTGVWSRWGPAKQRGHGSGRAVVARACEHVCMRCYQTVSHVIEIQSPVCVTALVLGCCYLFYDSIPWCGVQKNASADLLGLTLLSPITPDRSRICAC